MQSFESQRKFRRNGRLSPAFCLQHAGFLLGLLYDSEEDGKCTSDTSMTLTGLRIFVPLKNSYLKQVYHHLLGARSSVVFTALCCKQEGLGFDTR
jgi:hypothetical protein